MTEDQQAAIAKITLLNTRIMAQMAGTLYRVVEASHAMLPNARVLFLLSEIEQLQASLGHVQELGENCRTELGL